MSCLAAAWQLSISSWKPFCTNLVSKWILFRINFWYFEKLLETILELLAPEAPREISRTLPAACRRASRPYGNVFGANLGSTWANLEPTWAKHGPNLSQHGTILGPTWTHLEPTWCQLGSTWAQICWSKPTWANMERAWDNLQSQKALGGRKRCKLQTDLYKRTYKTNAFFNI